MDTEFPILTKATQNLIDSAKRFRKEGWGRPAMENDEVDTAQAPLPKDQEIRHPDRRTDMKVTNNNFWQWGTFKKERFYEESQGTMGSILPEILRCELAEVTRQCC